jgi:5-methylcytosine-specific restriction endonuclease McrA
MSDATEKSKLATYNERRRATWLAILGGRCAWCGRTDKLTFDCIKPTGDEHHRMSSKQRMGYYIGQARRGNLQVLCEDCNRRKSDGAQPAYVSLNPASAGRGQTATV